MTTVAQHPSVDELGEEVHAVRMDKHPTLAADSRVGVSGHACRHAADLGVAGVPARGPANVDCTQPAWR
jgi:hypothetical protein